MWRIREAMGRFMNGRYGLDELYRFELYLFILLFVLQIFTKWSGISILIWILFIFTFYRIFSRNIDRRRKENDQYLKMRNQLRNNLQLTRDRFRDRKTKVYRKCPQCNSVLRLPREKGQHTVTCPHCHHTFQVKV